ncbi:unnamed protein product [Lota lota]
MRFEMPQPAHHAHLGFLPTLSGLSMLAQHYLQVDLLPLPAPVTGHGGHGGHGGNGGHGGQPATHCFSQLIETADLLVQPAKASSFGGHVILDKETATPNTLPPGRNESFSSASGRRPPM